MAGDPVVDAARGVMDGHILLSHKLAGAGIFPLIDLAASANWVMMDVCDAAHLTAVSRFRRLSALIEGNRDLVLMGAYVPGSAPELEAALAQAPHLEAFRMQPRRERADPAASLAALINLVPA
jgi:flagellum-specific ATP synthase